MQKVLSTLIENKKVLILGFGREGRSTLREIQNAGGFKTLAVSDMKDIEDFLGEGVTKITGEGYLDCIDDFDVVFKSPGVVLKKDASLYSATITSEMDVFLEAYRNQVIGITGTKGKSTTSSMIAHVLKENRDNVLFAGNIGIPVFDIAEDVNENSVIVLEMSCHQLEYIKISPKYSVLLNIYEDHLDHYGTREKYAKAKKNIYQFQGPQDFLFTTEETLKECENIPSKVVLAAKENAPLKSFAEVGSMLKGEHNILNATIAFEVLKQFSIDKEAFLLALKSFKGLAHRLSFIGSKDGIDYYDDSISTTVQSSISAIESIENAGTILLGGMERNLVYDELIDYLVGSKLDRIVFMYSSGKRMYDMYKAATVNCDDAPECYYALDLNEAVKNAVAYAKEGSAIILSPAAASYDHFKNFEERGDIFKSLVF